MVSVTEALAQARAKQSDYLNWAEEQRKLAALRSAGMQEQAIRQMQTWTSTRGMHSRTALKDLEITFVGPLADAQNIAKNLVNNVTQDAGRRAQEAKDRGANELEQAVEALRGAVAGVGETAKQAFRDLVVDPTQQFIADTIRGSIGELMDRSIIGDVAKGVNLGEILSAPIGEVVKAGSPIIRMNFTKALAAVTQEIKPADIVAAIKAAGARSTVSPETGALAQGAIAGGSLAGLVALTATGAAIEAATLGAVKIPGQFLIQLGAYYGLSYMAAAPVRAPYEWGVSRPAEYFWAKMFTPLIPGATDLVRFELREVFRPEFRDELLTPRPSEKFIELMAYQGYDKFQAENYWAAHWDLPSSGQGFEMFQRLRPGKSGISEAFTEEDLRALLKRLDILPRYHDQLIDVAFRTLSRVDVRRMYRVGTLDRAGVLEAYLDLGYSPRDAGLMTDFTVKYESQEEQIDYGKSELIGLFKEGYILEGEFKTRARAQQTAVNDIERALGVARLRFELDFRNDQRATVITLYRKGKLSRDEATAKLLLIMPAIVRVATLLDLEDAKTKAAA